MHITGGGLLILLIIGVVILAIIVIKRLISGQPLPFAGFSIKKIKSNVKSGIKRQKPDEDMVLCLNIYEDKIVGEYMLKKSVCLDADIWEVGSKKHLVQTNKNNQWGHLDLPDDIVYPPERLARMMGCEPLRKLKSLKFTWFEKAAPFAPVVALLIGALLFIIVL